MQNLSAIEAIENEIAKQGFGEDTRRDFDILHRSMLMQDNAPDRFMWIAYPSGAFILPYPEPNSGLGTAQLCRDLAKNHPESRFYFYDGEQLLYFENVADYIDTIVISDGTKIAVPRTYQAIAQEVLEVAYCNAETLGSAYRHLYRPKRSGLQVYFREYARVAHEMGYEAEGLIPFVRAEMWYIDNLKRLKGLVVADLNRMYRPAAAANDEGMIPEGDILVSIFKSKLDRQESPKPTDRHVYDLGRVVEIREMGLAELYSVGLDGKDFIPMVISFDTGMLLYADDGNSAVEMRFNRYTLEQSEKDIKGREVVGIDARNGFPYAIIFDNGVRLELVEGNYMGMDADGCSFLLQTNPDELIR